MRMSIQENGIKFPISGGKSKFVCPTMPENALCYSGTKLIPIREPKVGSKSEHSCRHRNGCYMGKCRLHFRQHNYRHANSKYLFEVL